MLAVDTPYSRLRSLTFRPDSSPFRISMIFSSVNRLFFILRSPSLSENFQSTWSALSGARQLHALVRVEPLSRMLTVAPSEPPYAIRIGRRIIFDSYRFSDGQRFSLLSSLPQVVCFYSVCYQSTLTSHGKPVTLATLIGKLLSEKRSDV